MRKKRIVLAVVIALVAIQFMRPTPNRATQPPGPNDLAARYHPPAEVSRILEQACYDCHSDTTRYPWYAQVQPVGWWLASHVNDGKRALNFSQFGAYSPKKQAHKLSALSDQVTDHSMPLPSYTWIHRDARLSEAEIRTLTDWADALHDQIAPEE